MRMVAPDRSPETSASTAPASRVPDAVASVILVPGAALIFTVLPGAIVIGVSPTLTSSGALVLLASFRLTMCLPNVAWREGTVFTGDAIATVGTTACKANRHATDKAGTINFERNITTLLFEYNIARSLPHRLFSWARCMSHYAE